MGGTAELVHPSDASRVLAQPNPKSLAALLRPILQEARGLVLLVGHDYALERGACGCLGLSLWTLVQQRARRSERWESTPIVVVLLSALPQGLVPARPQIVTEVEKTWVVWHHMLVRHTSVPPPYPGNAERELAKAPSL